MTVSRRSILFFFVSSMILSFLSHLLLKGKMIAKTNIGIIWKANITLKLSMICELIAKIALCGASKDGGYGK